MMKPTTFAICSTVALCSTVAASLAAIQPAQAASFTFRSTAAFIVNPDRAVGRGSLNFDESQTSLTGVGSEQITLSQLPAGSFGMSLPVTLPSPLATFMAPKYLTFWPDSFGGDGVPSATPEASGALTFQFLDGKLIGLTNLVVEGPVTQNAQGFELRGDIRTVSGISRFEFNGDRIDEYFNGFYEGFFANAQTQFLLVSPAP